MVKTNRRQVPPVMASEMLVVTEQIAGLHLISNVSKFFVHTVRHDDISLMLDKHIQNRDPIGEKITIHEENDNAPRKMHEQTDVNSRAIKDHRVQQSSLHFDVLSIFSISKIIGITRRVLDMTAQIEMPRSSNNPRICQRVVAQ